MDTSDFKKTKGERRAELHDKKRRGMRVSGKSVFLIQEIIGKKAKDAKK